MNTENIRQVQFVCGCGTPDRILVKNYEELKDPAMHTV